QADARWTAGGLVFEGAPAALDWLEEERANLLAAIAQAAAAGATATPAELAGQLTQALSGFFLARSYWHDWAQANRTALEVARRQQDRAAEMRAQNDLGLALLELGRYEETVACHRETQLISGELGDRDYQAGSVQNLGIVYGRMGRDAEAIELL